MNEEPIFKNYKERQNYYKEKYKNRGKVIHTSIMYDKNGNVIHEPVEMDESVSNVQNHSGSFASIIEQNIDEIDSLINKGDRDALLNRLQELVDEANLTGKNLERANSYMRGLRTKRDLSSLAVSLYDIKLAAMDKENKVITTNKKRYEDCENRGLEGEIKVSKGSIRNKLKSGISKVVQW